jgi:hypothetical protein
MVSRSYFRGRRMSRSASAVRKLWARAVQRFQEEWESGHE